MAEKSGVAQGLWFIGTDTTLRFTVYADADHTSCVDASSYAMSYVLRKGNTDADPPCVEKATGDGITVAGAFNSDPDQNEQRVLVSIEDTDTEDLRAGEYQHALKRTDAGFETILAYTDADTPAVLTQSAAR